MRIKSVVTVWVRSDFAGGGSGRSVKRMRELERQESSQPGESTAAVTKAA